MVQNPVMRNTLMLVVLLAGTYGFAQEQPHISPASEKAGNKAGTWEVPANTEDTILHRMAEENTEYLQQISDLNRNGS